MTLASATGGGQQVLALSPGVMQYAWLIPVLPFLAFVAIIFLTRKSRVVSAGLSIGALFVSFLISAGILAARLANPEAAPQVLQIDWIAVGTLKIGMGVLIDNLSAMMLLVVTLIGFLIQVYSTGYMESELDFGFAKFFAYLSLFTASMLGLVLATNFVQIYVFWELVGLSSYLLIGFWYQKNSAADACKKAFVVTRFGDLGFLMGILIVFQTVTTLSFVGPDNALAQMARLATSNPTLLTVACVLIFCGAVGKSAQFPLHIWLPDAMEGPTPVSALIHAATMVAAGIYLVARCFDMFQASHDAMLVVAYIGGFTALFAATMGVVQNDIKRVMAYSTVSQLGYMLMALGIGTSESYVAGNFHLFTHAFFKALLFLCAGSVIHAVHSNDMWEMGGLRRFMPITHATFLAGSLALTGIWPFAGFWSKDEVLASAWAYTAHPALAIFGYTAAFITSLYVARLYFVTFWGEYRGCAHAQPHVADAAHCGNGEAEPAASDAHGGGHHHQPHENKLNMTGPLMILALAAVFIGFVNAHMGPLHVNLFGHFLHPVEEHAAAEGGAGVAPIIASLALAVFGWVVGWFFYAKQDPVASEAAFKKRFRTIWTILENKYYMDELWAFLVRITMFAGATACDWFDRFVIDGLFINGTGSNVYAFGQALREEHSGKVQQYAMMMIIALVLIIIGVSVAEAPSWLTPAIAPPHLGGPQP